MNTNIVIIICLIILISLFTYKIFFQTTKEKFTSEEAIQDVANMYKDQKLTVGNIKVLGNVEMNALDILPKGIIVAWNNATPPTGWALCDGNNGTPDLRGRFIYGFGANKAATMNAVGGLESVPLTTLQMPEGTMIVSKISEDQGNNFSNYGYGYVNDGSTNVAVAGLKPMGTFSSSCGGGGGFGGGFGNQQPGYTFTGKNQGHENLPPYFVLAYIMKL